MSVEQDIMTAVMTNMNNISIANGYTFDVGSNVFEWRDSPLNDGEFPAIIVKDVYNEVSEEDEKEHTLTVEIQLVDSGNSSPASIRAKVQDILTAFYLIIDEDFVASADFRSAEKAVEKADKRYSSAILTFFVYYYSEAFTL
jgi:hypothetical protein